MTDRLVDIRDIQFVLYEVLNVEKLLSYERYAEHSRETFDMVIAAAYKLGREVFWPAFREMDTVGVKYDPVKKQTYAPECMHRVWKAVREGGWTGISADYEYGGQQFPETIARAVEFILNAANTAAYMYPEMAQGVANLIKSSASQKLKDIYIRKLYGGEWGGCMALTEPQAGSSLGNIKAAAVKATEGEHYLLRGVKIFASSGDHDLTENIVEMVLARLPGAPPGVKGISLFLVPKYRVNQDCSLGAFNNVVTGGVEHKLGLRGQATVTLNLGDDGDCHGWLVGEENKGLTCMFQLMNATRIQTGVHAAAVAANAYQNALAYARERLQGRSPSQKDPVAPQIPIIKHPEVRRMLLAQKAYVEGSFCLLAYAASLMDITHVSPDAAEREHASDLLEILTPVCKAYCSDIGFRSTNTAIQVLGGYGFSEEFPLAQMLRDQRVFSIYEGTNNIQAMDLLGRKVIIKNGASFDAFIRGVTATIEEARSVSPLNDMTGKVEAALRTVIDVTRHLAEHRTADLNAYMSYASPYLRMFSQLTVSWLFLRQSVVARKALEAGTSEEAFYMGKLAAAQYFINNELPYAHTIGGIIKGGERTALDCCEEWF